MRRRLGPGAARLLLEKIVLPVGLVWIDEEVHQAAAAAFLAAIRSSVSLVDRVSFEVMRRRGIEVAFAFDRDFRAQGFATLP